MGQPRALLNCMPLDIHICMAGSVLEAEGVLSAGSVSLSNVTDEIEILHVAGARAAELMGAVCPEALDVPFLQMRELSVCGVVRPRMASQTQSLPRALSPTVDRRACVPRALVDPFPLCTRVLSSTFVLACPACLRPSRCLLYTSPSPRDGLLSRMPSSA